jgi:hypothetical protein
LQRDGYFIVSNRYLKKKSLEDGLEVNREVMVVGKTSKVEPVVNS